MVTSSKKQSKTTSRKKTSSSTPSNGASSQTISNNGTSTSNAETLRGLYASLLKSRMVQEAVQRLSPAHPATQYQLAIRREAVTVAATADLRAEDAIVASRWNLAALVARGLPAKDLLAQMAQACSVGALTPASLPEDPFYLGAGLALAHKLEKKQNVVVALCGQESPALDRWRDALQAAALQKLPILYVIETAPEVEAHAKSHVWLEDFSYYMKDYGFPNIMVDGYDLVAVWRVAQESIHRARNGSGPTLIECRFDSEKDPLAHMEHYLQKRSVWDEAWQQEFAGRIKGEIKAALAGAGV